MAMTHPRVLSVLLFALSAAPAIAQDAPPSVQDFRLEPPPKPTVDPRLQGPGLTPAPAPLPTRRPSAPTAGPPPAATPAPTPAPPPAPAARPTAGAAPTPRPSPAPAARPTPRATPPATVAAPTPRARAVPPTVDTAPDGSAVVQAPPAAVAPPVDAVPAPATASPRARPAAPLAEEGSRWPLVLFALAGLMVAGAVALAVTRRRRGTPERRKTREPRAEPAVPPARPQPMPAPTLTAMPTPAPPAEPLVLTFEPLEARATALGSSLKCRLTVTNVGDATATGLTLDLTMAGAGPEGDARLARFAADGSGQPPLALPDLPPGESHTVDRSLRVGARDFRPIQLADRAIFVPLVGLDLTGRIAGEPVRATAAHIVGRTPREGTRMGPFRVDQGPRHYRELGQRPHALAG